MKHSLFLFCLLIAFGTLQAANAIYRDSSGRSIGTASTSHGRTTYRHRPGRPPGTAHPSPNGSKTIYRDRSGRSIGTATTQSNGSVIFRDASGRQVGTASSGQALPPPDTIFFKP